MQNPDLALFHASLSNANQFIQDAQILLDHGSIGHSYGLSVLAFEELGKALLGMSCYLGIVNREDEEFKIIFKDHIEKQINSFNMLSFMILMEYFEQSVQREKLLKIINEYQSNLISVERYNQDLINFLENDHSELAENILRLIDIELKFIEDKRWLDKRKQRAFYVDLDPDDQRVLLTPQDNYEFEKSNVQEIINSHRWHIDHWREVDIEIRKRKHLPSEFVKYRQAVKKFFKDIQNK